MSTPEHTPQCASSHRSPLLTLDLPEFRELSRSRRLFDDAPLDNDSEKARKRQRAHETSIAFTRLVEAQDARDAARDRKIAAEGRAWASALRVRTVLECKDMLDVMLRFAQSEQEKDEQELERATVESDEKRAEYEMALSEYSIVL